MLKFVLERSLSVIPVMLTVLFVVFIIVHIGPGDPAALMAGPNANGEQIEAIRQKLNLDKPLMEQFWIYFSDVIRFDLGRSVFSDRPVSWLILQRVEPTLVLAITTTLLLFDSASLIVASIPLSLRILSVKEALKIRLASALP